MRTPPVAKKNLTSYTQSNRAAWDASAAQHEGGERWQRLMAGFAQPGFSAFDATATYLLRRAGVKGSRVVQVGCNIGGEVLSCPIAAALLNGRAVVGRRSHPALS